jgi:hypothetical protein
MKFECPICHIVVESDFSDEFEVHVSENHLEWLETNPDFESMDYVINETETEKENLCETGDESERILDQVEKSLEPDFDTKVEDYKKQMVHDYLAGKSENQATKSMMKQYLMEFLRDRDDIFHMHCAKHPERTWDNKGDYILHLRKCQPHMLSRYDRIMDSLPEELKLKLPEPTGFDWGSQHYMREAKAWTEYAMTIENVTTPSGSQPPAHQEIPREDFIDEEKEQVHCSDSEHTSEMLSEEASKLGVEFKNVPIGDQVILLAFLKKKKEELSRKNQSESLGDMGLGYQGHA